MTTLKDLTEKSQNLTTELMASGHQMMLAWTFENNAWCWSCDFYIRRQPTGWHHYEPGVSLDINEAIVIAYKNAIDKNIWGSKNKEI